MGFIDKIQEKDLPDYQQQFSSRTMKNYVAQALVPFGTNSLSAMLFSSYLSFVYTQYLGVAANVIAVIISIGIIVDGVTDFLMGFIVDRYRTKWGKAKHWFFVSALLVGATMVLMFMIPESTSQMAKVVYVFVMYNLFCTALTTVRLPGGSLIALVSDSPKVHRNLAYIVEVASAFAGSTLGWIMAPMLSRYGDNLQTYRYITFICGAITVIALLKSS
jgi:glycoside/pentoside/hexuronide:cation symporter, GPH family